MSYYCYLDSTDSIDSTNLQLYSLQQAADRWNELVDTIKQREINDIDYFKERLSFILVCFGLSLSQLLGQNSPSPYKDKVDQPGHLLGRLLTPNNVDRTTQGRLNRTFRDFLSYYGIVRHFGKNKDDQNYRTIDQLTLQELDRFRHMTVEIWDVILAMYQRDDSNNLGEIGSRSISEVVRFSDLPEQGH